MDFMQKAIDVTKKGIKSGQSPFGACIEKNGRVISCTHNTVWMDTDSTAHAEINAIRAACKKLGTIDLSGCTIYSTTEPCPMCFSAIHWAKIDKIVYGASIADAKRAGFSELTVSNSTLKKLGKSKVRIESGVKKDECKALFSEWKEAGGKTY
jgi:guanine deaminase